MTARAARDCALVAAAYFLLARATLALAIPPGVATPIWPASGLALAAAARLGRRGLAGVWLGSFAANVLVLGHPVITAVIAIGSTVQAAAAARLLRTWLDGREPFGKPEDAMRFGIASLTACLIATSVASLAVQASGLMPEGAFGLHWVTWWLGDAVGMLTMSPLLLACEPELARAREPRRLAELALLLPAVGFGATVIFLSHNHFLQSLGFLILPLLVAATMRFGGPGVTLSALVLSVPAILGASRGLGRFHDVPQIDALLLIQGLIGSVTLTGAILASALADRRQAERDLESAVASRTAELLAANAELKRSNDDLRQFAYVASHDLKEPVRKISGFVELIARRFSGRLDADAERWIGYTVDASHRLYRLIDDLLDYARLGHSEGLREAVDLDAVAASVMAELEPGRDARIERGDLPSVFAVPFQMRRLLQNLLSNALKFRADRPLVVVISAEREGSLWRVCVADNGIGVAPEFSEKIFGIFERLHAAKSYGGTGIGLAICKKIVDGHGGRIWVESRPGEGSRFFFTLPPA